MIRNEALLQLREAYIEIGKWYKNMDMDNITGY